MVWAARGRRGEDEMYDMYDMYEGYLGGGVLFFGKKRMTCTITAMAPKR